jgi:hypothetical protein
VPDLCFSASAIGPLGAEKAEDRLGVVGKVTIGTIRMRWETVSATSGSELLCDNVHDVHPCGLGCGIFFELNA